MTDKELAEYAPLWGSDAKKYLLLNLDPEGTDLGRCMIVDRQNKSIKLIENRELVFEVMRRMLEVGVEMVRKLPVD
jgi:hypothetical protein